MQPQNTYIQLFTIISRLLPLAARVLSPLPFEAQPFPHPSLSCSAYFTPPPSRGADFTTPSSHAIFSLSGIPLVMTMGKEEERDQGRALFPQFKDNNFSEMEDVKVCTCIMFSQAS
ncbi:uncharacterized protein LOC122309426 [Carya illinoinensis]|uniref:uncharacterized protein LOC122309426 n=1 Tax=Carya illinoinensis TaxID=32201 RepID=UPI001C72741B|nr:uncharacterized protein LOC122309426 [Carya illinoinensis]